MKKQNKGRFVLYDDNGDVVVSYTDKQMTNNINRVMTILINTSAALNAENAKRGRNVMRTPREVALHVLEKKMYSVVDCSLIELILETAPEHDEILDNHFRFLD